MAISSEQLEAISRIPERLEARSIANALVESGYREVRRELSRAELADYLARHPSRIRDWVRYSEEKQTSGGWYLLHPTAEWIVGRLAGPEEERELRFRAGPEACAEFILRELDSVAADAGGTSRSG